MRRSLLPILLLVLAGCMSGPPSAPVATAGAAETDPLTPDGLFDATFALTSIGARQVATAGEIEARDWLLGAFHDAGLLEVALEPFTFDAWRPGSATVEAGGQVLEVEALSPSPETELTVELVTPDQDFAGKAVLFSSLDGTRAAQFLQASLGGAAAMVRSSDLMDHDGGPLVEVGHTLEGSALPSVAVDHATGAILREHLGEQITIAIAPDVAWGHTSHNVVGRLPGTGQGSVYVVAHYDSWHPSESAFDNALGVGALVQLARSFAGGSPMERELVFLATSGEEQGLQGALAWTDAHATEVGPDDVAITLDVMWSGEGAHIAMATDPELMMVALEAAEEEGIPALDGGGPTPASDHFPFQLLGADAVWTGRWPDRHYHTEQDTLDNLDVEEASAAMRVNRAVIEAAAGGP